MLLILTGTSCGSIGPVLFLPRSRVCDWVSGSRPESPMSKNSQQKVITAQMIEVHVYMVYILRVELS